MNGYRISFFDVSQISDDVLRKHYQLMSDERKAETLSLASDLKKRQKIAADMLCRQMIAEECGISPESIVFEKNSAGKPFAVNAEIFFGISHSDNLIACAVSQNEIGIDIEKIRDIRLRAAEKFACESEKEYINNSTERFFEIWTLKEAFFKCKGTGLGADIKSVCFDIDGEKITCSENGYKLSFEEISIGYICSVCVKEE